MQIETLKKLDFTDKTAKVYLALLQLGPSSVRGLADFCSLNRGTTYDSLKWLQENGVVSFYKKESKQHFVAEHPEKLHELVRQREVRLSQADSELSDMIPELQALHARGGERPIARYFDSSSLHEILQDVLDVCEQDEKAAYRIYSAAGVREFLYDSFPTFSDARIAKGVGVRVIAIGDGGELRGLDERKWLKNSDDTLTFIIIYPGKTAYISLNAKGKPVGVVIENEGIYKTERQIFDSLWETL
ncbi:MAG: helix-turn-helix domain-containing protein [Candidatus Magasanikbacteria bacterium]